MWTYKLPEHSMRIAVRTLPAFLIIFTAFAVHADHWPQFRGPRSDGLVRAAGFPLDWDTETNIRWKIRNPGEGWSAPIVWGNKLFLTAAVLQQPPRGSTAQAARPERYRGGGGRQRSDLTRAVYSWEVYCLDAETGQVLWRRVARHGTPRTPRHSSNTYATETPVTDGQRVYVYFGMTGLFCYDFDGDLVWQKDLGNYETRAGWGTASSPILYRDKLFLQIDNQEQSFLVALDAKSGEQVWRVPRDEATQYSSPIIWENSKRAELVAGGMIYRSYDPETGSLLWQLDMAKGRSSATPVADGDRLYIGTEFRNRGGPDDGGGFLFAVKAGATADITPAPGAATSDGVAWRCADSGIQMASPVVCEGYIYLFERRMNAVNCVDAKTGEHLFRERISGARAFWSSPWAFDGHVYALDETGTVYVIEPGRELKVLRTNRIDELTWSTPAAANGCLFLRGADHLYCIAQSGE
jgi:outer membrane protein assembly factor BamB